jgi:sulfonate transport system substrate-binding protein
MNAKWLARAAASVSITAISAPITSATPLNIRVDWTAVPGQFAPLIPALPDYAPTVYRHYGQSYVVEPLKLAGGGATLTALAVGDTNVSTLNPQSLVLGITNAKLNLRVIGQQISTEVPGYRQTYFWVQAAKVKTIGDLKGKVIGVNALASVPDAAAETMLSRYDLKASTDYQLVEVPFAAGLTELKEGAVDATALIPPFSLPAETDSTLKPIFGIGDAFGPFETSMWVATADFIEQHRPALVDFLEDNIRMRRWMADPKTRDDAIRELSDVTKIPADRYASWVYSHQDYYYDPHAMVDVKRLQKNIDDLKSANVIPVTVDISPYVDLSLVEEASARAEQ